MKNIKTGIETINPEQQQTTTKKRQQKKEQRKQKRDLKISNDIDREMAIFGIPNNEYNNDNNSNNSNNYNDNDYNSNNNYYNNYNNNDYNSNYNSNNSNNYNDYNSNNPLQKIRNTAQQIIPPPQIPQQNPIDKEKLEQLRSKEKKNKWLDIIYGIGTGLARQQLHKENLPTYQYRQDREKIYNDFKNNAQQIKETKDRYNNKLDHIALNIYNTQQNQKWQDEKDEKQRKHQAQQNRENRTWQDKRDETNREYQNQKDETNRTWQDKKDETNRKYQTEQNYIKNQPPPKYLDTYLEQGGNMEDIVDRIKELGITNITGDIELKPHIIEAVANELSLKIAKQQGITDEEEIQKITQEITQDPSWWQKTINWFKKDDSDNIVDKIKNNANNNNESNTQSETDNIVDQIFK